MKLIPPMVCVLADHRNRHLLIAQEGLIAGINWRSQFDTFFKVRTCYPNKACCMQASLEAIKQFNVSTSSAQSTSIA